MAARLPKGLEYGAFVLALTAGCVNVVGLLGVKHQSISHLSGSATLAGVAATGGNGLELMHLGGVLLSFLLGAGLCGVLWPKQPLHQGARSELMLAIEGTLLLAAMLLLHQGNVFGHFVASAACGLQNALTTQSSNAIMRTTHVTGIFTDLGLMLGNTLKGHPLDKRKAWFFVLIIFGFIAGGSLGAFLFPRIQFLTLTVPASLCFFMVLGLRAMVAKI